MHGAKDRQQQLVVRSSGKSGQGSDELKLERLAAASTTTTDRVIGQIDKQTWV